MAKRNWLKKAVNRMKRRGTIGAFGKATTKKIAAARKRGGLAAKRANFAANMKKISARRKRSSRTTSRKRR